MVFIIIFTVFFIACMVGAFMKGIIEARGNMYLSQKYKEQQQKEKENQ